jgi:hypothetical protein
LGTTETAPAKKSIVKRWVIVLPIAGSILAWALLHSPRLEISGKSIPVEAWFKELPEKSPVELSNPLPFNQKVVDRGREKFELYCSECHDANAVDNESAGRDLAPIPADLRNPHVQGQTDAALFSKISLGFGKHPPLADTLTAEDRWALIRFIRYLSDPSRGWRAWVHVFGRS